MRTANFLAMPDFQRVAHSGGTHGPQAHNGFTASRPAIISAVKLLLIGIAGLPLLRAAPTKHASFSAMDDAEEPPMSPAAPTLWIYLAVAVALVLLGGAFAGLTIALMGQVFFAVTSKRHARLTTPRTRSIYKLSRHLAKARRGSMLQKS